MGILKTRILFSMNFKVGLEAPITRMIEENFFRYRLNLFDNFRSFEYDNLLAHPRLGLQPVIKKEYTMCLASLPGYHFTLPFTSQTASSPVLTPLTPPLLQYSLRYCLIYEAWGWHSQSPGDL